jgi:hypothetical protein
VGIEIDAAARECTEARKLLGSMPLLDAVRDYVKRYPASLKKMTVQDLYADLLKTKREDESSDVYLKDLKFRLGKFSEAFHCNASETRRSRGLWSKIRCGGFSPLEDLILPRNVITDPEGQQKPTPRNMRIHRSLRHQSSLELEIFALRGRPYS